MTPTLPQLLDLTLSERQQIATILSRRANEIAMWKDETKNKEIPASVEYGLSLEIARLRKLEDRVRPPKPDEEEE